MLQRNFLIFIATITLLITPNVFSYVQDDSPADAIAVAVRDAANEDKISNTDLGIWYSIYRGTYLYGAKMDFDGTEDFGVIFDKQRKVRDKMLPSKTDKFGKTINAYFDKYKTEKFDDNSKNELIETANSVAEGIRLAID